MQSIDSGVWPTMITPFDADDKVDYQCLEHLVEWYISRGVNGLFAVCQSSEMFFLSLDERVELAEKIVQLVDRRTQVIASGHISETVEDQAEELSRMAETGIDALVLLTNRFANGGSDDRWKDGCETLLDKIESDIPLGMYECPYPFRRDLSPELLSWCGKIGRFIFLKDTCSCQKTISGKLAAIKDTGLKLFNANSATLLESLREGGDGYCGVMANFHPHLYRWLVDNHQDDPEAAEELSSFLTVASVFEYQKYPVNAKHYLALEGLKIGLETRKPHGDPLTESQRAEIRQLRSMTAMYEKRLPANC